MISMISIFADRSEEIISRNSPEVSQYQVASACNDSSPLMRPACLQLETKPPSAPVQVPKPPPDRPSLLPRTSENYSSTHFGEDNF
jgi:hypothetical protein